MGKHKLYHTKKVDLSKVSMDDLTTMLKGFDVVVDLLVDGGNGRVPRVEMIQMNGERYVDRRSYEAGAASLSRLVSHAF